MARIFPTLAKVQRDPSMKLCEPLVHKLPIDTVMAIFSHVFGDKFEHLAIVLCVKQGVITLQLSIHDEVIVPLRFMGYPIYFHFYDAPSLLTYEDWREHARNLN